MGYNKFIKKDGKVLLDLTSDTVASDKLMSGVTAHNRSGEAINGTFTIDNELATQDNLIAQIQTALEGKASGEDLDEVISELEEKIDTLNSTLANKAAGGSGVETCTVSVTFNGGNPNAILISGTQLINGDIQTFVFENYTAASSSPFPSPYIIENIIKDSPLTIVGNGYYMLGQVTCSGCEMLCRAIGMGTVLSKITDSNASVVIKNDY